MALFVVAVAFTLGCGDGSDGHGASADFAGEPEPASVASVVPVPPSMTPRDVAVVTVEGLGEIHIELLPSLAPASVANFIKLAGSDTYDGTLFHRVIPGFTIQGGDPNSKDDDPENDGRGGPGYGIQDEFSDVSFVRGIVGMARTDKPNSAGSQFFIVHEDARHLDGEYTVFGHVVRGIDVVDAMTLLPIDTEGANGPKSRPVDDLVISDIRIESSSASRDAEPAPQPAASGAGIEEWDEG